MSWAMSAMGDDEPITIMLVSSDSVKLNTWRGRLEVDARFRIVSTSNDLAGMMDFLQREKAAPEVYFVDGRIFTGPEEVQGTLSKIDGMVYMLVPESASDAQISQVKGMMCVKSIYRGDANLNDWISRAWTDATAKRRIAPPVFSGDEPRVAPGDVPRVAQQVVTGTRVVTVWSRSGGTGRSTLATGLAMASARKGIKTLLIGLDAPDVIPLHVKGLKPDPSIMAYIANPGEIGLRASIQRIGDLDVIAGFPEMIAEARAAGPKDQQNNLVQNLVQLAAFKGGYAAIIIDTPANSEVVTPGAIAAANSWVMVCRPTLADAWNAVDAFRMVSVKAAGEFRIEPGNITVVLNQRTQGQLSAGEWHRAADQTSRASGAQVGFPPVAAVIPFIAELPAAQDAGRPAMDASDEFARQANRLADALFGSVVGQAKPVDNAKVFKFGPIKIRSS